MSLVSASFAALFAAVFVVYWLLPGARAKNGLLVGASVAFYGWAHPWMALVLLTVALAAYVAALAIERFPERARWLVAGVVGLDLLLLCAFKYLDWLAGTVSDALAAFAIDVSPPDLGWLLPLGLSFYTFQSLGYVIDVARGDLRARRNLVDYLAFAALFPPLVAGPIERARRLLPQVEADRRLDWARVRSGLTLALWGAFTKVVIADTLAPYVDAVDSIQDPPGMVTWAASLAFGVQLYGDFAGYTNLARGLARMLGFELIDNFDEPFLATSTPEFWRRWHISLSSWLRDYLLVPLLGAGGETATHPLRLAGAVVVTFVVIGVWHGPGWHYVAFGLWHAGWSLTYLLLGPYVPRSWSERPAARWLAAAFHIAVVLTPGSFLFRGPTLGVALDHLGTPPWDGGADAAVVAVALLSLTAAGGALLLAEWVVRKRGWIQGEWVLPFQTTAWAVVALALVVFHPLTTRDFLYFRF